MRFVVRLFPEITIKSPSVRKHMTKQLVDNLRVVLKRYDRKAKVISDWDNLEVVVPGDDESRRQAVADMLSRVSGIAKFARVQACEFSSLDDIYQRAAEIWGTQLSGKTFCVRVKRRGKHAFNSADVERYVGGGLNQNFPSSGVNLSQPGVTVPIEIRDGQLFIVEKYYQGLGGYPMGVQGAVLSLVSGGYDSTVASYLSMKRGLKTHYLFFNLGGKAHELAVKELSYFIWQRFSSSHRVKFISVPFDGVVNEIVEKVDPSCMGVVLKRVMLRAAQRVARKAKITTLVTGEAVAQVSSQTLRNLSIIDSVTDNLVLRPLALMNKGDIIDISRVIGTEDFSASIPEYCGVISIKPSAHLRLKDVESQELNIDVEGVLDDALDRSQMQAIDEVMKDVEVGMESVESVATPGMSDIVIDIRHPDERDAKPLPANLALMSIPFYSLNSSFAKLDRLKRYLLYCDKGVMSQLHASHLLSEGHFNVAVYRPS